jgi:RHS repeat-associated protein
VCASHRWIDIPELPFTITVWVNPVDYADWRAILSKRDSPPLFEDSRLDVGLSQDSGHVYLYTGSSPSFFDAYTVPVGSWTHLAVVATASATRLYVNGVLRQTIAAIELGSNHSANAVIGGTGEGPGGDNDPFKGKIDELRLYSGALTQAQIQAVMNTPLADTVAPTAPAGLSASAAGAGQINLAWSASTDNVGVTGYRVERCQGAGCSGFAQIATPAGTSFSDTGLTPSTSYSYRVRAADAAGNLSAYSNVASASTQGGQLYYIVPDHLNTPRLIADQAGNTVWRNDNTEPFGDSVPNDDPNSTGNHFDFPLRFAGQYFDRETGLFYNVNRDYDAGIGRYPESDPIGLGGGINTYAYARGNPIIFRDPLGLDVTMTCRPLSPVAAVGMSRPVHCAVFVWHYDGCGRRVIDAQYSLPFGSTSPTRNPSDPTYADDKRAFGGGPGNYPIPAPAGMSHADFDRAVMNSGNNYSQGPYFPAPGPNSNTAAGNIITGAGGTLPNIPGAVGMGYQPFTGGSIGDIIAP